MDDLKAKIKNSPFFTASVDESSAIDNTEYLSIQIYFLEGANRISQFLCLAKIDRQNAQTITRSILECLSDYADISIDIVAGKFIGFASDGASAMMGCNSGVSTRLSQEYAPYMTSTHDFGHRVALCCGKLKENVLFAYMESFLKVLYAVFSRSTNQCTSLKMFQALANCPLLAVLKVHEIRWLSVKGVLDNIRRDYPALLLMFKTGFDEQSKFENVYQGLSDLRFVVGPVLFESLLKELNALSKKCQEVDVIFDKLDFAVSQKIELITQCFIDEGPNQFSSTLLSDFLDVKSDRNDCTVESPLFWKTIVHPAFPGLNVTILNYAIFDLAKTDVELFYQGTKITDAAEFQNIILRLKSYTTDAAKAVVEDLRVRFPQGGLLDAFSIFHPKYWQRMQLESQQVLVVKDVQSKLDVLIKRYTVPLRKVDGTLVNAPIDAAKLRDQFDNFMVWMPGSIIHQKTSVFWKYIF